MPLSSLGYTELAGTKMLLSKMQHSGEKYEPCEKRRQAIVEFLTKNEQELNEQKDE